MQHLPDTTIRGIDLFSEFLSPEEQAELVEDVRKVVEQAPLFSPETSRGQKMSVRMTSAGEFGWVSDRRGYRYEKTHPTGVPWPAIPASVLAVWNAVVPQARMPQSCLVNYYSDAAKMGLHQDRDEQDFSQPVVSISLGDEALFRIGNDTRGGSTESVWLRSGDVMVMGGEARLRYHGIDRVKPATSMLLPKGGRLNLTLRVVT